MGSIMLANMIFGLACHVAC
uniref:Uncharacterized protein n=1 Tax=Arundo donax TaxID=35708 RepID=A0A0A9ASW5_ARUDO